MRYISIGCIAAFYIFFFARAFLLKKKLGKTIKANDFVLNLSILCAGLTSVLYILQKTVPALKAFFPVFSESFGFELAGTILLAAGLVISSLASLGLGRSWRIGVNEEDATQLVTGGLYSLSRNPYFLSYDIVLIGLILSSLSPVIFAAALATIVLFHLMILREERFLESVHGQAYREYRMKVRRYI